MRLATFLAIAVLPLAAGPLSCGQLATADSLGPEGTVPGSSQFAPGTVGNKCAPKDDGCQWLSNECASDPDCAHWYQCILSCKADGDVNTCMAACAGGKKLPSNWQKLQGCLLADPNCTVADGAGGSGGTKGPPEGSLDGGYGMAGSGAANSEPDAGMTALNDGGETPNPESQYANCHDCAYQACIIPLCQASKASELCIQFKVEFVSACWGANPQHEWALENCMYTQQTAVAGQTTDAHSQWIADGITQCVDETCPHLCTPPDYHACLDCQRSSCKDQYDAFLGSADAQDYQWCRTHCDFGVEGAPVPDVGACKKACGDTYPEGQAIVGPLLGCKVDQCGSVCAGLP